MNFLTTIFSSIKASIKKFSNTNVFRFILNPITFLFLILLIVGFFMGKLQSNNVKLGLMLQEAENKLANIYETDTTFTDFDLYKLMRDMRIQNIDVVFAQAQLETGYFKKDIFLVNNNVFGMRKSYTRPTMFSINKNKHMKNFAYYVNWKNSVIDYALWQSAYARNLDKTQYIKRLTVVYANGESDYGTKLVSIMKRNELKLKTYDSLIKNPHNI